MMRRTLAHLAETTAMLACASPLVIAYVLACPPTARAGDIAACPPPDASFPWLTLWVFIMIPFALTLLVAWHVRNDHDPVQRVRRRERIEALERDNAEYEVAHRRANGEI